MEHRIRIHIEITKEDEALINSVIIRDDINQHQKARLIWNGISDKDRLPIKVVNHITGKNKRLPNGYAFKIVS